MDVDVRTIINYMRGHWGIETGLHGSLDVTFREDTLRNRIGRSAEDFSRIRAWPLTCSNATKPAAPESKARGSKPASRRIT